MDMLRARRAARITPVDEFAVRQLPAAWPNWGETEGSEEEEQDAVSHALLSAASAAQEAVCRRVDPETWRGYWMIAIEDSTVREAADSLGKKYTAVYNGYRRVERMLQVEGQHRLAAFTHGCTGSNEPSILLGTVTDRRRPRRGVFGPCNCVRLTRRWPGWDPIRFRALD